MDTDETTDQPKPQIVEATTGRPIVDIEPYTGHGPDDPHGWYYRFEGESKVHWISAGGYGVRFTTLEKWQAGQAAKAAEAEAEPESGGPTP